MTVDAKDLTISSLLKKGKFIIPDYQREYDWGKEEIDEFLSDIDLVEEDDDYFIGSIVVTSEFSGEEFKVIDGQQRITTITILLAVLRDKLYDLSEETLAIGINTFIFNRDSRGEEYAVLENRMPYPFLQAYVQSNPEDKNSGVAPIKEGEKKIKKAYDHIKKYTESYVKADIESLRDRVLKLIVVFVTVDNETNAFAIFETLNGRGKDLSAFDLIKNQVFKYYPKLSHINEPNDTWNKIKKNIGHSTDKFLNNFWASRYKKVAKRKIYKEFEYNILRMDRENVSKSIKSFVCDLHSDSEIFKKIIDPKLSDWESITGGSKVFFPLYALKLFKVEIANAFIMTLIREYTNEKISFKKFVITLRAIEKFHFIHTAIGSQKGSGLDIFYAGYAEKLNNASDKTAKHRVLLDFKESLKAKLVLDKESFTGRFQSKLIFSKSNTKNKALVKYVLDVFEKVDSNCSKILLEDSIEHIYPENPNEDWDELSEPGKQFEIGNLVLLDRDINSKVGNKKYEDKRGVILRESTLVHTKKVFEENATWVQSNLDSRTQILAERAYDDIWKL